MAGNCAGQPLYTDLASLHRVGLTMIAKVRFELCLGSEYNCDDVNRINILTLGAYFFGG